ncbi:DHH family phosphoesterase [Clostridium tagluense]|uniref:Single-stranded-DNA-specific exonuclease RecJ n=1 Tax=Clostridium tagluense TaxID=360422 RepID=A0A401UQ82_9CLOT|nr:DHH family phosphoesterase [Clostridium tagluense]GCD11712.1 single-stranded-DNA-specific exonuclease RecJ [Clostridium tagluense]
MDYKIKVPQEKYEEEDNIITKILKIRGIENKQDFLYPSEKYTHSHWELSSMREAVDYIIDAIENNCKVGIYGDIDADGVTSLAIIYHYLIAHGITPILLYHQRGEGHGVIVDKVPKDLDLLIIVDSSSNCVEECKELSEDMNIVILDHHESDVLNRFATIVNPQFNDYPNKFLCGAGVCYKTCQAIDEVMCTTYSEPLIDYCAVGMIGDMMNVSNLETRHLIMKGLFKIHNNCSLPLQLILKHLKKDFRPNSTTISFYLVPFINSIIRLEHIEDIIAILTSNDEKFMKAMIKKCAKLNEERKVIQAKMLKEVDKDLDTSHKVIYAIAKSKDGNSTLNGLVANNIMKKYQKPTFILGELRDKSTIHKGSGRSLGDIDVRVLMNKSKLVVSAEGHQGAFGVEIEESNLDALMLYLDDELKDVVCDTSLQVEMELKQSDITWEFLKDLEKISFIVGEGFKEPLFLLKCMFKTDVKVMKIVHVKLTAGEFDCMKFNIEQDEVDKLSNAFCFDTIGSLAVNSFYNFGTKIMTKSKQILMSDIHIY